MISAYIDKIKTGESLRSDEAEAMFEYDTRKRCVGRDRSQNCL